MKIGKSEAEKMMGRDGLGFHGVATWNRREWRKRIRQVIEMVKEDDFDEDGVPSEAVEWVKQVVAASNDGEEVQVVRDEEADSPMPPPEVDVDAGDEPVDEGPEDLDGAGEEEIEPVEEPVEKAAEKPKRKRQKRREAKPDYERCRLTMQDMKEMLGWEEEAKKGEFGKDYLFADVTKTRVRCTLNATNRWSLALAKRYCSEFLRGEWKYNGQPVTILDDDQVGSGVHRLVGAIFAEQTRQNDPIRWGGEPIVLDTLVVRNVPSDRKTVDTIDIGRKRSLGDVLYCGQELKAVERRPDRKRLTNVLAGAVRVVWLRVGGKRVSDAPHFPHSEALAFLEEHPGIREAVELIGRLDVLGGGKRCIGGFVSLAYAAGTAYLMNEARNAKATEKFWTEFADGSKPLHPLRLALRNTSSSSAEGRDKILSLIARAFDVWSGGEDLTAKDLKLKKGEVVLFGSEGEDRGE